MTRYVVTTFNKNISHHANDIIFCYRSDLVPGDVFEVPDGSVMMCDAVLLEGYTVMNEADLTGEPMPISKVPLEKKGPEGQELLNPQRHGKLHFLWCGTKVLQSQGSAKVRSLKALAICVGTGTQTQKGEIMRKILHPAPVSFEFNDRLMTIMVRFILFIQCVQTIPVLYNLINSRANFDRYFMTIVNLFGLDSLSMTSSMLSPVFLLGLTYARIYAAKRMQQSTYQVSCGNLPRVVMAGEVDVQCLDKTGTLTTEGLSLHFVQPVEEVEKSGQQLLKEREDGEPLLRPAGAGNTEIKIGPPLAIENTHSTVSLSHLLSWE